MASRVLRLRSLRPLLRPTPAIRPHNLPILPARRAYSTRPSGTPDPSSLSTDNASQPPESSFLDQFSPVEEDTHTLDPSDDSVIQFLEKLSPEQLAELDSLWDNVPSDGLGPVVNYLESNDIHIQSNSALDKILRGDIRAEPIPPSPDAQQALHNLSDAQSAQLEQLLSEHASLEPAVNFLTGNGFSPNDALILATHLKMDVSLRTETNKLPDYGSILPDEIKQLVGSNQLPFPESHLDDPQSNILSPESTQLLKSTFSDEQRQHIESLWRTNPDSHDPFFDYLRQHNIPDHVSRQLANEIHLNDTATRISAALQDRAKSAALQIHQRGNSILRPDEDPLPVTVKNFDPAEKERIRQFELEINTEEDYDPSTPANGHPEDLRTTFQQHDATEVFDIPPSKDSPFHNRVTIHNHVPMFAAPEELIEDDLDTYATLKDIKDTELTPDEKALFDAILKKLDKAPSLRKLSKGIAGIMNDPSLDKLNEEAKNKWKNIEKRLRSRKVELAKGIKLDEPSQHDNLFPKQEEIIEPEAEEPDSLAPARVPRPFGRTDLYISSEVLNSFYYNNLIVKRVVQQTGLGKMHRFKVVTLLGNGHGIMGVGAGKHENLRIASTAAKIDALKNIDWVELFEGRTLWTDMETKVGTTRVYIRPRPLGFGLRCNPYLHAIMRAAGIKDASAKVWGSRNPTNVIYATVRMLQAGHNPVNMGDGLGGAGSKSHKGTGIMSLEDLERTRGRKIIPLLI